MNLVPVYREREAVTVLYELLEQRPKSARISHQKMPTMEEHAEFVRSKPYAWWYLIEVDGEYVGDIHATELNELGVFLFERCKGKGYATGAVRLFMERHKPLPAIPAKRVARWLANIAPKNKEGKAFFKKLGFKKIQETLWL